MILLSRCRVHTSQHARSIKNLFLVITLLLVFIINTRTPVDADMWWHLRTGEEMWQRGEILTKDVFSYTRYGAPWVNAFWISDLGMYGLFSAGKYLALGAIVALLGAVSMGIVYVHSKGAPFLRTAIIILAALAAAPVWTPRPQLLSFLILAWLDYWMALRQKKEGPPLWLLPLVFSLWANLHGGFIWGFLLLIAYLAGNALSRFLGNGASSNHNIKALFLWILVSALAVSLNPNGIAIWRLPFNQVKVSIIMIQEWLSPDFHQVSLHPFLGLVFLLLAGIALSGKRLDYSDLLKVVGFSYLAFVSQRNLAPFAIIIAPIISIQLNYVWEDWKQKPSIKHIKGLLAKDAITTLPQRRRTLLNIIIIGAISLAALTRLYLLTLPSQIENNVPAEAVQWIETRHPPGRIFNSYNWGGYLLWALHDYPVFIDGRADLYGAEIIDQWWEVTQATETGFHILDKWQVHLIVLEPTWPIVKELPERGWKLLYHDEKVIIYGR